MNGCGSRMPTMLTVSEPVRAAPSSLIVYLVGGGRSGGKKNLLNLSPSVVRARV